MFIQITITFILGLAIGYLMGKTKGIKVGMEMVKNQQLVRDRILGNIKSAGY